MQRRYHLLQYIKGGAQPNLEATRFYSVKGSSVHSQTLQLRDKRTLGFAEYGDHSGVPLFYFHPALGSRIDGTSLHDLGNSLSARIICPDRPGHGLSTFQRDRVLLDFPADILDLAQHLKIDRFCCVGESAGGPYALACAYALPSNILFGTGIIAGIGPWTACRSMYPFGMSFSMASNKWLPGIMRVIYDVTYAAAKRGDEQQLRLQYREFVKSTPDAQEDLQSETSETKFVTSLIEALRQGQKGHMQDTRIFTSDWGFKLENVSNPVKLWYGMADNRVPVTVGGHFENHLQRAELKIVEDADHFSISQCYPEVMETMISAA